MSFLPCSACKKRVRGKLATIYVAAFSGSGRIGWRQRLCGPCTETYASYVRELKPIPADDETVEWPEACSGCGGGIADDFNPTYLTIYMPKSDRVDLIVPTCDACSLQSRPQLIPGAESLTDRVPEATGRGEGAPSHEAPGFASVSWSF